MCSGVVSVTGRRTAMCLVEVVVLWPGMPNYVFEDRSSENSRCLRPQAREWSITSQPWLFNQLLKPNLNGKFSLLKHTAKAIIVLIGRSRGVRKSWRHNRWRLVSAAVIIYQRIPMQHPLLLPPLVATQSEQISFILIQTYLSFSSILNKSTDIAYNTIHIQLIDIHSCL